MVSLASDVVSFEYQGHGIFEVSTMFVVYVFYVTIRTWRQRLNNIYLLTNTYIYINIQDYAPLSVRIILHFPKRSSESHIWCQKPTLNRLQGKRVTQKSSVISVLAIWWPLMIIDHRSKILCVHKRFT